MMSFNTPRTKHVNCSVVTVMYLNYRNVLYTVQLFVLELGQLFKWVYRSNAVLRIEHINYSNGPLTCSVCSFNCLCGVWMAVHVVFNLNSYSYWICEVFLIFLSLLGRDSSEPAATICPWFSPIQPRTLPKIFCPNGLWEHIQCRLTADMYIRKR